MVPEEDPPRRERDGTSCAMVVEPRRCITDAVEPRRWASDAVEPRRWASDVVVSDSELDFWQLPLLRSAGKGGGNLERRSVISGEGTLAAAACAATSDSRGAEKNGMGKVDGDGGGSSAGQDPVDELSGVPICALTEAPRSPSLSTLDDLRRSIGGLVGIGARVGWPAAALMGAGELPASPLTDELRDSRGGGGGGGISPKLLDCLVSR